MLIFISRISSAQFADEVHLPAHFSKGDLSKLATLVNFWLRTGTACIEISVFPG